MLSKMTQPNNILNVTEWARCYAVKLLASGLWRLWDSSFLRKWNRCNVTVNQLLFACEKILRGLWEQNIREYFSLQTSLQCLF